MRVDEAKAVELARKGLPIDHIAVRLGLHPTRFKAYVSGDPDFEIALLAARSEFEELIRDTQVKVATTCIDDDPDARLKLPIHNSSGQMLIHLGKTEVGQFEKMQFLGADDEATGTFADMVMGSSEVSDVNDPVTEEDLPDFAKHDSVESEDFDEWD